MKKYDIIDEKSGKVIGIYNSDFVEKYAKETGKDVEEFCKSIKNNIMEKGLHYWVTMDYEIIPLPANIFTKGGGKYFDTYEKACEYQTENINKNKNNNGK